IGGGTVRDLILGVPVFWVADPMPVILCSGTAVVVYFTAHLVEYRYRWLLWCDAVALAAYGVFGAFKGYAETGSGVIAVVMAALTGSFGGILRDVLANEPSVLLRREIYVTAPVAGGAVFVAATLAGAGQWGAVAAGVAVAFAIRAGAIGLGWSLPVYRSRPGRPVGGSGDGSGSA
ncbi:MAG: trimeric intracellular cation channel family protein, partial [Gemmobacter sp.]